MEVKPGSDPTRSEAAHDVEGRLGSFLSDYITLVSVWRPCDHPLSTDMCHYDVCRHVSVLWDQVGHPCQSMREPTQDMSTEEEELDLLVGYSTPLSVHSVDGRCESVYYSASQLEGCKHVVATS